MKKCFKKGKLRRCLVARVRFICYPYKGKEYYLFAVLGPKNGINYIGLVPTNKLRENKENSFDKIVGINITRGVITNCLVVLEILDARLYNKILKK